MPAYEPKRPRPTPQSPDTEAQVDALLDAEPTSSGDERPPSSNPFADPLEAGVSDAQAETAPLDETAALNETAAPGETAPDETGTPGESAPQRRVQPLPPEPDGHGPGPVVPMTVVAVLGFLVLLFLLRRRRRRPT